MLKWPLRLTKILASVAALAWKPAPLVHFPYRMIKPFAMQTIALIASLALARAPSVPSLSKAPKPYNHYEEELVSTQSYRGSSSSF